MQLKTTKHTSLSTTKDVKECLDWKINALNEAGLDIQEALADYMALSIDEIDSSLRQLIMVKKEIAEREKSLKNQKSFVLEECANFLVANGADRFEGNIVSSVTVTKGKPESSKTKFKLLTDKKAMEAFLVDSGLAVYESVDVPATEDVLRINKRKIALSEVVDEN